MRTFLARRFLFLIPQIFIVTVLSFVLIKLVPGDPAAIILGPLRTEQGVVKLQEDLGLNKSWPEQYWIYLKRTVQGDFGESHFSRVKVTTELARRLPITLWLITIGAILCVLLGIGIGYLAALTPPGGWLNKAIIGYGFLAGALPDFWVGLILIFIFFVKADILPAPTGQLPSSVVTGPDNPDTVTHIALLDALLDGKWNVAGVAFRASIMPIATLVLVYMPVVLKITAVSTADVYHSQFVAGARAVGVRRRIIVRYILRNALLPIVTTTGVLYAFLLGGAVLIETVFSWGGFGQWSVTSVTNKDFNPIQTFMLVAALFTILVYLAVDLLHFAVDPRIRAGRRH